MELVIVIAVIAVLAAVLIPTFANIVNRANESSDIQAVRNMNTALAVEDALGEDLDIHQVYEVLAENGINAENYTPLYSDRFFFYDGASNRVVYAEYVNGTYNVIFPEGMKQNESWQSLNGQINTDEATIDLPETVTKDGANEFEVSSAADFIKLADFISENENNLSNTTNITIELTSDINLMGADVNFGGGSPSVTLTSNESGVVRTISGLYVSAEHAQLAHDSDGNYSSDYGNSMFTVVYDLTVKDIAVDNATIGSYVNSQAAVFAGRINHEASFTNVTVTNSSIYGTKKCGVLFGFMQNTSKLTLSNVTLEDNTVTVSQGEAGILGGCIAMTNWYSDNKVNTSFIEADVDTIELTNNTVALAAGVRTVNVTEQSVVLPEKKGNITTINQGGLPEIFTVFEDDGTETKMFDSNALCFVADTANTGLNGD